MNDERHREFDEPADQSVPTSENSGGDRDGVRKRDTQDTHRPEPLILKRGIARNERRNSKIVPSPQFTYRSRDKFGGFTNFRWSTNTPVVGRKYACPASSSLSPSLPAPFSSLLSLPVPFGSGGDLRLFVVRDSIATCRLRPDGH